MKITQITNTKSTAIKLFDHIAKTGITSCWDLDEVLFCAKHRQKLFSVDDVKNGICEADQVGMLDLNHYRANTLPHLVKQDKSLPLLECVHMLNNAGIPYHVATARVACNNTQKLLRKRGVYPSVLIAREGDEDNRRDNILKSDGINKHFAKCLHSRLLMIDDNLGNVTTLAKMGLKVLQVIPKGALDIRGLL